MNYSNALTLIDNTFTGKYNSDEKTILESMLIESKVGSVAYRMITDLLTNDFNCVNCGYVLSNIEEYQSPYTKKEIIAFSLVVAKVNELEDVANAIVSELKSASNYPNLSDRWISDTCDQYTIKAFRFDNCYVDIVKSDKVDQLVLNKLAQSI